MEQKRGDEMSILIRGMEMPKKCGQCKLYHAEYPMYCLAVEVHRTVGAPYGLPRPDWCPLQDTAYKKGLHYGESKCGYCNEYQRGLDDAWEAARKLFSSMADSDIEKAFPIEWNNGGFKALMNLQPQEAIAKLKAYEEKQKADDEIKVGDEVRHERGWSAVVTSIDNVGFSVKDYTGEVASYSDISKFTKTGRHFDIPKILEEMKE